MPEITRTGRAAWSGDLRSGQGRTSTASGAVSDLSYSVGSRFEDARGTNPEELIAAAHASCFSMMLSKILSDQQKPPTKISTEAKLTMRQDNGGVKITGIHLVTEASVKGMDAEGFKRAAEQAKEQCPVSTLLKPGLEKLSLESEAGLGKKELLCQNKKRSNGPEEISAKAKRRRRRPENLCARKCTI